MIFHTRTILSSPTTNKHHTMLLNIVTYNVISTQPSVKKEEKKKRI